MVGSQPCSRGAPEVSSVEGTTVLLGTPAEVVVCFRRPKSLAQLELFQNNSYLNFNLANLHLSALVQFTLRVALGGWRVTNLMKL